METINVAEEREEGEIVEDELDDVSEGSLSPPISGSGKSVSPRDLFRGVSLSSVRETKWRSPPPRRRPSSTRKTVQKRRKKRCLKHLCGSDLESPADPSYVKQLRTALKHDISREISHNDLETRLQLVKNDEVHEEGESDEDQNLVELRRLALESKAEKTETEPQKNSDNKSQETKAETDPNPPNDDSELIQLRLEALKSQVLTNHERRKLKKVQEADVGNSNKENNESVINNDDAQVDSNVIVSPACVIDDKVQNNDNNGSQEEDLDILFATVLATLSTNLTNKELVKESGKTTAVPPRPNVMNKPPVVLPKPVVKPVQNEHNIIQVKPLIIRVNPDSDSDEEIELKEEKPVKHDFGNTVEEFLRKQRAEVESQTQDESQSMDKSAMKLLPKSQQLEYRRLKQLLNARKRARLRKASQSLPDKVVQTSGNVAISRKVPNTVTSKNGLQKLNTANVKKGLNKSPTGTIGSKNLPKTSVETVSTNSNIKKTLDDLQIHKDGRFQMKGKYQPLAPLLQRVHQAGNRRSAFEKRIKSLLEEIQQTRTKYFASHQLYTNLVQQLVKEKEKLDLSTIKISSPVTSTPKRSNTNPSKPCDIRSVKISEPVQEVKKQDIVLEVEPNLQDPNDVTLSFVNPELMNIPKYVSPLCHRKSMMDPLTTFCPFDLLGTCKDTECAYVHSSKISMS